MSVEKLVLPKRKKKKSSIVLKIAFIAVFAVVGVSIASNFAQLNQVNEEKARLEEEVAYYEEQIDDLSERMLEENWDSVIESIAREQYSMLKDGETIYGSENF